MMKLSILAAAAALVAVEGKGVCNDLHRDCANWAKKGHCTGKNKEYMLSHCPISCGTCKFECKDKDESCPAWAKQGECEKNKLSMLSICPTSCGICAPVCKDVSEDCKLWHSSDARFDQCTTNPEFMLRNCPVRAPRAPSFLLARALSSLPGRSLHAVQLPCTRERERERGAQRDTLRFPAPLAPSFHSARALPSWPWAVSLRSGLRARGTEGLSNVPAPRSPSRRDPRSSSGDVRHVHLDVQGHALRLPRLDRVRRVQFERCAHVHDVPALVRRMQVERAA
jgi:hypothetical protein